MSARKRTQFEQALGAISNPIRYKKPTTVDQADALLKSIDQIAGKHAEGVTILSFWAGKISVTCPRSSASSLHQISAITLSEQTSTQVVHLRAAAAHPDGCTAHAAEIR